MQAVATAPRRYNRIQPSEVDPHIRHTKLHGVLGQYIHDMDTIVKHATDPIHHFVIHENTIPYGLAQRILRTPIKAPGDFNSYGQFMQMADWADDHPDHPISKAFNWRMVVPRLMLDHDVEQNYYAPVANPPLNWDYIRDRHPWIKSNDSRGEYSQELQNSIVRIKAKNRRAGGHSLIKDLVKQTDEGRSLPGEPSAYPEYDMDGGHFQDEPTVEDRRKEEAYYMGGYGHPANLDHYDNYGADPEQELRHMVDVAKKDVAKTRKPSASNKKNDPERYARGDDGEEMLAVLRLLDMQILQLMRNRQPIPNRLLDEALQLRQMLNVQGINAGVLPIQRKRKYARMKPFKQQAGWISPEGDFHAAPDDDYYNHAQKLGLDVDTATDLGWQPVASEVGFSGKPKSKFSPVQLDSAALKAGLNMFGPGNQGGHSTFVFPPVEMIHHINHNDPDITDLADYCYLFYPHSPGKGLDASLLPFKAATKEWADKDGLIYMKSGEDMGEIVILDPKGKFLSHAQSAKYVDDFNNGRLPEQQEDYDPKKGSIRYAANEAREFSKGYWLSPEGKLHPIGGKYHSSWLQQNTYLLGHRRLESLINEHDALFPNSKSRDPASGLAYAKGWHKITVEHPTASNRNPVLLADNEAEPELDLNDMQKSVLIRHAKANNLRAVYSNSNEIWSNRDRPEQYAATTVKEGRHYAAGEGQLHNPKTPFDHTKHDKAWLDPSGVLHPTTWHYEWMDDNQMDMNEAKKNGWQDVWVDGPRGVISTANEYRYPSQHQIETLKDLAVKTSIPDIIHEAVVNNWPARTLWSSRDQLSRKGVRRRYAAGEGDLGSVVEPVVRPIHFKSPFSGTPFLRGPKDAPFHKYLTKGVSGETIPNDRAMGERQAVTMALRKFGVPVDHRKWGQESTQRHIEAMANVLHSEPNSDASRNYMAMASRLPAIHEHLLDNVDIEALRHHNEGMISAATDLAQAARNKFRFLHAFKGIVDDEQARAAPKPIPRAPATQPPIEEPFTDIDLSNEPAPYSPVSGTADPTPKWNPAWGKPLQVAKKPGELARSAKPGSRLHFMEWLHSKGESPEVAVQNLVNHFWMTPAQAKGAWRRFVTKKQEGQVRKEEPKSDLDGFSNQLRYAKQQGLTDSERRALKSWTDVHDIDWNTGWDDFYSALPKLQSIHGPISRGTMLSRKMLGRLKPGSVWRFGSPESWTTDYNFAKGWAVQRAESGYDYTGKANATKALPVVFSLPKHSLAKDLTEFNPEQSEVLVPSGARIKVKKVTNNGDHHTIELEEVTDKGRVRPIPKMSSSGIRVRYSRELQEFSRALHVDYVRNTARNPQSKLRYSLGLLEKLNAGTKRGSNREYKPLVKPTEAINESGIPADFAFNYDIHHMVLHPKAVWESLPASLNNTFRVVAPDSKYFVKSLSEDPYKAVNPEEVDNELAARHVMQLLGHKEVAPMQSFTHPTYPDTTVSPWYEMHQIADVNDAEPYQYIGAKPITNLLTSEWLVHADDRHHGNYGIGPNGELHGLDYGWAFEPLYGGAHRNRISPADSRLFQDAKHHGVVDENTPLDKQHLANIIKNKHKIMATVLSYLRHSQRLEPTLRILDEKFNLLHQLNKSPTPTIKDLAAYIGNKRIYQRSGTAAHMARKKSSLDYTNMTLEQLNKESNRLLDLIRNRSITIMDPSWGAVNLAIAKAKLKAKSGIPIEDYKPVKVFIEHYTGEKPVTLSQAASKMFEVEGVDPDLVTAADGARPAGFAYGEPGEAKKLRGLFTKYSMQAAPYEVPGHKSAGGTGIIVVHNSKLGHPDLPRFLGAAKKVLAGTFSFDDATPDEHKLVGDWLGYPRASTKKYLEDYTTGSNRV